MWFSNMANNIATKPAYVVVFIVVLVCLASILPDIDHPVHYYMGTGNDGRFLHNVFALAGAILLCFGVSLLITFHSRLA